MPNSTESKVVFNVNNGPFSSTAFIVEDGETKVIGRGDDADFVFSDDSALSRSHFSVTCHSGICELRDLSSANGTYLNGKRVTETQLQDNDTVRAGDTAFDVTIEFDDSVLSFNQSWTSNAVPGGWEVMDAVGFRRNGENTFPSTVVVTEDNLAEDETLGAYITKQVEMLRTMLKELQVTAAEVSTAMAADECHELYLRHMGTDGKIVLQRQIYLKRAHAVGIVTLTSEESEYANVKEPFDTVLSELAFQRADESAT